MLLREIVLTYLFKGVLSRNIKIAAGSAANAGIHKKILGSGKHPSDSVSHINTILIISNDQMKDIIKIVKYLKDSSLLLKGVSETIQNESKGQKGGFLSILLGTLGKSFPGNIFSGKGINRVGEGVIRAGYGNKRQDHKNKIDF